MKRTLLAAALCLAGGSAWANTIFDCTMDGAGHGGDWVAGRVVILYDEAGKRAKVSDAAILHFVGAPVDARVAGDTGQRVTFVWSLKVEDRAGTPAAMQYRATWQKAARRMHITANALQYGQRFNRSGKCVLSKVK